MRAKLECKFIITPDFTVRVGLRPGDNWLRCDQRHVIASQRAVHVRLLLVAGVLEDVVAHEAERLAQVETGCRQSHDECCGEMLPLDRAMFAVEPAKQLRLIILDACRDNPFAKSMKRTMASRAIGRGLAKIEPTSPNTMIASRGEGRFDSLGWRCKK